MHKFLSLLQNLQLLVKDNERLQNLLKWKEHEDVFWRWMESVLDAKLEDKFSPKQHLSGSHGIPNEMISQFHSSHQHLQETIAKYESIINQIDEAWDAKVS
jgi:hypothetical protein